MLKGKDILIYLSYKYQGNWDKIYDAIVRKEKFTDEEFFKMKENLNCDVVTILDDDYPDSLKNVYKPPFVIYYHGDITLLTNYHKILSVVGSREPSIYSVNAMKEILKECNNEFVICSGMALGIDGEAHKCAMAYGGKTIAVLASGINYPYPKTHKDLYEQIKKNNLVISEFPGELVPDKENFPFRNRLITGLSWGIFVPEVKQRSGTMVSIGHAISQNKEVLILPQPARNGTFNNSLIQEGACLVESGNDILHEKI